MPFWIPVIGRWLQDQNYIDDIGVGRDVAVNGMVSQQAIRCRRCIADTMLVDYYRRDSRGDWRHEQDYTGQNPTIALTALSNCGNLTVDLAGRR